jgi:hypothetical protein
MAPCPCVATGLGRLSTESSFPNHTHPCTHTQATCATTLEPQPCPPRLCDEAPRPCARVQPNPAPHQPRQPWRQLRHCGGVDEPERGDSQRSAMGGTGLVPIPTATPPNNILSIKHTHTPCAPQLLSNKKWRRPTPVPSQLSEPSPPTHSPIHIHTDTSPTTITIATPPTNHPPSAEIQGLSRGAALRRRHARPLQPPRIQAQPLGVLLNVVEARVLQAAVGGGGGGGDT